MLRTCPAVLDTWTTGMSCTVWHQEGGKGQKPLVLKIQTRPDPLAKSCQRTVTVTSW